MKDKLEAKLTKLKENRDIVMKNINDGQDLVKKAMADLQAISGAIQVCEQLLSESKEDEGDKPVEIVDE